MKQLATDFAAFAEGTRPDFHEPDEQGIKFVQCRGVKLDNAFGDKYHDQVQEVVIEFVRNGKAYAFNLANLLALAKAGAKQLT